LKGANDFVLDTPASSESTDCCPVWKDSRPGVDGLDMINNYMDYSDDACVNTFTPGQVESITKLQ
jgi:hypothetical protein